MDHLDPQDLQDHQDPPETLDTKVKMVNQGHLDNEEPRVTKEAQEETVQQEKTAKMDLKENKEALGLLDQLDYQVHQDLLVNVDPKEPRENSDPLEPKVPKEIREEMEKKENPDYQVTRENQDHVVAMVQLDSPDPQDRKDPWDHLAHKDHLD